MKDQKARARDIERALEQVEARAAQVVGVLRLHAYPEGVAYRAGRLQVSAEPEIHDGEIWIRLRLSRVGTVSIDDLAWCRDAFVGRGRRAMVIVPSGAEVSIYAPIERDPLPAALAAHLVTPEPTR